MANTATATPGKTRFLMQFLHNHPHGNTKAVNEAWRAAGFEGTISPTLVNKTRASLGLARKRLGNPKAPGTAAREMAIVTVSELGRPRTLPTTVGSGQRRGRKSARTLALTELEADIDRLIFKVMGAGDLTEIEDSLRHARRLLYVAASGR